MADCAGILEVRTTVASVLLSWRARHSCIHWLRSSQVHPAVQCHSGQGTYTVSDTQRNVVGYYVSYRLCCVFVICNVLCYTGINVCLPNSQSRDTRDKPTTSNNNNWRQEELLCMFGVSLATCINYANINNSMLPMHGHVSTGFFPCDVLVLFFLNR